MSFRFWSILTTGLVISILAALVGTTVFAANETIYVAAVLADAGGNLPAPTTTSSPQPLNTPTSQATQTATPSVTPTATETPLPTVTASATATAINILTPAATPTATNTPKPTNTPQPTATARPTQTPTRTPRPEPTPEGENVMCQEIDDAQICAWVSDATPRQNSDVTVFGRLIIDGSPIAGADMLTTWHYKTTTPTEECITQANGIGECTRSISRATIGYQVDVDVEIFADSRSYKTETFFVPEG